MSCIDDQPHLARLQASARLQDEQLDHMEGTEPHLTLVTIYIGPVIKFICCSVFALKTLHLIKCIFNTKPWIRGAYLSYHIYMIYWSCYYIYLFFRVRVQSNIPYKLHFKCNALDTGFLPSLPHIYGILVLLLNLFVVPCSR